MKNSGNDKIRSKKWIRRAKESMLTIFSPEKFDEIIKSIDASAYNDMQHIKDLPDRITHALDLFREDERLNRLFDHIFNPGFPDHLIDQIRPHHDFPIETETDLAAPIVRDPIYECTREIYVSGFMPKALVKVYAGGSEVIAEATPHYGFADFVLTRPVDVAEELTATQTANGLESNSLAPVIVQALPNFPDGVPPAPRILPPVFRCGRVVNVDGLIPGAQVELTVRTETIGKADSSGVLRSVGTRSTPELMESDSVVARQTVCRDIPEKTPLTSGPSAAMSVSALPDPFQAPMLQAETNIPGNDSLTFENLYVGALLEVHDGSTKVAGGFVTGSTNWVALNAPIESDWRIEATQKLCGHHATSEPESPGSELAEPILRGPLCNSDTVLTIENTVMNATVVILVNGTPSAMAGAQPGARTKIGLGFNLSMTDTVSVLQYLGDMVSDSPPALPVYQCDINWTERTIGEILDSAAPEHRMLRCTPSSVPVFQNADPYDALLVTLEADFNAINADGALDQTSPGRLIYTDVTSGLTGDIDCTIEGRGNSRQTCGWRPLRIRFDGDPVGTLFEGTGRHIDTVTHCGYRSGQHDFLAGTDEVEHDRRLLQEHVLYQALKSLRAMTLETRLARFTYSTPTGSVIETRYGFIRERKSRAPDRCGMERLEAEEDDLYGVANIASVFEAEFHHLLLFHRDYKFPNYEHNVVRMTDGSEDFYFPYDFDLSAMGSPDYWRNNGWSLYQHGQELQTWLHSEDSALARTQVADILQGESQILDLVHSSPNDAVGQAELELWIDQALRHLKVFLQT